MIRALISFCRVAKDEIRIADKTHIGIGKQEWHGETVANKGSRDHK